MNNDPELNGKYLGTITEDFAKVSDTLKEASYQIIKRGISEHPIFPVAKMEIPIGQTIIPTGQTDNKWAYNASFLREFEERKLVTDEGVEAFKAAYRDPDEFCCLFVVDKDFTNFLFIPYPED